MKSAIKVQNPIKDFQVWHSIKEKVHNEKIRPFFHEREVWWCSLGANVGFEQDGKGKDFGRPVVIYRKFNNEVFWAIPLSTKSKKGKFYMPINLGDKIDRVAIISQLRLIDGKRLYQKIGWLRKSDYKKLRNAVLKIV